jgi:hypothetical protein
MYKVCVSTATIQELDQTGALEMMQPHFSKEATKR